VNLLLPEEIVILCILFCWKWIASI